MQVCMHLRLKNSGALQKLPNPASRHVKLKLTALKCQTCHAIPDALYGRHIRAAHDCTSWTLALISW